MGLCHEFGTQIRDGCDHPMRANADNCSCPDCGTVCDGLFEGCPDVWARGPQPVSIAAARASSGGGASRPAAPPRNGVGGRPSTNGRSDTPTWGRDKRHVGSSLNITRSLDTGSHSTAADRDGPRTDVVDWFDGAFEGLREELRSLSLGMTQQEAMVAELLDTRQGELRLVLVAEALPDLVADAVSQAMADHLAGVIESNQAALDAFRQELKRTRKTTDAAIAAVMDSVKQTLADVTATLDAHTGALGESEAGRARAIKGSVTRQVAPLVATVAETAARTDAALGLLGRKVDRVSAALDKNGGGGAKANAAPKAAPKAPSKALPKSPGPNPRTSPK